MKQIVPIEQWKDLLRTPKRPWLNWLGSNINKIWILFEMHGSCRPARAPSTCAQAFVRVSYKTLQWFKWWWDVIRSQPIWVPAIQRVLSPKRRMVLVWSANSVLASILLSSYLFKGPFRSWENPICRMGPPSAICGPLRVPKTPSSARVLTN